MADETITITIKGAIDGKIAGSLREIATQALSADTALDTLRNTLRQFSAANAFRSATSDVHEFRNEVNRAATTQKAFATATDAVTSSTTSASTALVKYNTESRKVVSANAATGASFKTLSGLIGNVTALFGGIFVFQGYVQAQDALTGIQNKIRSLTDDMERQANVQQKLFEIANRTRSGVEATTDGFVRFSKAMQTASDDEVLRFVETLNKSLISAGRSTAEVNSIVIQLGQALTSGRLMGDEFRSLSENLPREALQAIADQLGVGVDQLKELSSQGVITTEVLRTAFAELATSMDEQFNRTIPTISQALTVLNNQFIAFTQQSSGAAAMLSQAIMFIANNLNIILPLIAAFGAAWATVQLVKLVGEVVQFAGALISLAGAITAANAPLLLIVGSVIALGAVFLAVTGQLEPFVKWLSDDLPKAIGGWIGKIGEASTANDGLNTSLASTKDVATATGEGLVKMFGEANTEAGATKTSVEGLSGSFIGLNAQTQQSANSFVQFGQQGNAAALQVSDALIQVDNSASTATGSVQALGSTATSAFSEGASAAGELTNALVETESQSNAVISTLQSIVDWASSALSAIGSVISAAISASNSVADAVDNFTGARPGAGSKDQTPGFYKGGSMMVNGKSGVDKNYVGFRATKGERVDILTPAQQREQAAAMQGNQSAPSGSPIFIFNIQTPDADSFRLSRQQLASTTHAALA
jgi:tape measure domain-containing protein